MTAFDEINAAFRGFDRFFVGADTLFDRLNKAQTSFAKSIPTYPPFNIRKTDESHYVIEIACVGFGKNEIDIELDGDNLIVSGRAEQEDQPDTYLFKGLGKRAFQRNFLVNDKITVKGADMVNGMLRIHLENLVETNKRMKIAIDDFVEQSKQLLTEATK